MYSNSASLVVYYENAHPPSAGAGAGMMGDDFGGVDFVT